MLFVFETLTYLRRKGTSEGKELHLLILVMFTYVFFFRISHASINRSFIRSSGHMKA